METILGTVDPVQQLGTVHKSKDQLEKILLNFYTDAYSELLL